MNAVSAAHPKSYASKAHNDVFRNTAVLSRNEFTNDELSSQVRHFM
jgi:hypothetical protein